MCLTHTFYYGGYTKEQDNKHILPNNIGIAWSIVTPLYEDKQLTKKIGDLLMYDISCNKKQKIVLNVDATIITSEGSIKYIYIRNGYKPIIVDTQLTSGIFKQGTIKRSYITPDKSIRKIIYKSSE